MNITDSHCHLDDKKYDSDRKTMIDRAVEAGVGYLISIGTDIVSIRKNLSLAEEHDRVYAAIGIHPHEAAATGQGDFDRLRELVRHRKVVAIGETGLDFYRNHSPVEHQTNCFRRHLEIATGAKLPVVIHSRQATNETIAILKDWVHQNRGLPGSPGVIHCFSGDWQAARQFLQMGFYLSFAGYISYPHNRSLEVLKQVPRDRILIETDAPYLPPQPYRGKRNEPAYITHTLLTMAAAIHLTPGETAALTTNNARALFKLS